MFQLIFIKLQFTQNYQLFKTTSQKSVKSGFWVIKAAWFCTYDSLYIGVVVVVARSLQP